MKKFGLILGWFICVARCASSGTATATTVVIESQVDDQRSGYVGKPGELTWISDAPATPVVVHDGSSSGGVARLVSLDGAVLRSSTVTITNEPDWRGWSTTGELRTNGVIALGANEWLKSPTLTGGVSSYDVSSIYSDGGNKWQVVLYTNTLSTPVEVPYTGKDARLRISHAGFIDVPDSGWENAVKIPGVSIVSYSDPDLIQTDSFIAQLKVLDVPRDPEHIARLDTVTIHHAQALAYTDREIVEYDQDTGKVVRGSMVFSGGGWSFQPATPGTNTVKQTMAWGGFPMLEFLLGVEGCTIDNFAFTATNAVFGIATNGVESAPVIEYTPDLSLADWQAASVVESSWPDITTNGTFDITIDLPDSDQGFFRAMRKSSASATVRAPLFADELHAADGITTNLNNLVITDGVITGTY